LAYYYDNFYDNLRDADLQSQQEGDIA